MCVSACVRVRARPPHPVDEVGLGELDDLQGDQEADGDQVVEENDEG